jgi:glycosyltransferase involved in cell wall biosynthesis
MANFKISACIITLNEAEHIRAACESVAWADEIVVVDSGSTDRTQEMARECSAHVIERPALACVFPKSSLEG